MDFRELRYVLAIARCKTLSKAAETLYLSQPSLTKFLQTVEGRLQTPLFSRVNKQLIPTYAGEKYLEAAKEILLIQERLESDLGRIANENEGRLRVATTTTRGYYVIPRVLPEFKKLHPRYHVDMKERNVHDVEQSLRDEVSDLAIYAFTGRRPEFEYEYINTEEVVICVPGDSPYIKLAEKREGFKHLWIDLTVLKNEIFYINDPTQWKIGEFALQLLREAGIRPEITNFRSLETCLTLAASGAGVAFGFDICEGNFRNYAQKPVFLSVGERAINAEFSIAYRKGYKLTSPEKDFISLVRHEFGPSNGEISG